MWLRAVRGYAATASTSDDAEAVTKHVDVSALRVHNDVQHEGPALVDGGLRRWL